MNSKADNSQTQMHCQIGCNSMGKLKYIVSSLIFVENVSNGQTQTHQVCCKCIGILKCLGQPLSAYQNVA